MRLFSLSKTRSFWKKRKKFFFPQTQLSNKIVFDQEDKTTHCFIPEM
jgi:hypothetical protein